MFAKIYKCGLVLIVSLLLFCASWNEANADQRAFIVVFDQSISEIQKEAVINQFDGIIAKDLKIINGKAIILDEAKAFDFSKSPGVMRLTIDDFIQLDSPMKQNTVSQLTQVTPWGVQATGSESLGTQEWSQSFHQRECSNEQHCIVNRTEAAMPGAPRHFQWPIRPASWDGTF